MNKKEIIPFFLLYMVIVPFFTYLVGYKDLDNWIDNPTYQNYFFLAQYNNVIEIIKNGVDPLFLMLMRPFTVIKDGYGLFLLICAYVTLNLKFIGLRRSTNNFPILLVLYASYLLCLHDYVQIRIALSMAFVTLGIYLSKTKKSLFIFFIVAILVHVTSLFVILPFLFYKKFGAKSCVLLIAFSFFLPMLFFSGLIKNARLETYIELAKYKEQYATANVFASQPILQMFGLIYIYINSKLRKYTTQYEYIFSVLGVLCFYLFIQVPVLSFRLFELTMFFYIIILSRLFFSSKVIMLICLLYVFVGLKNMFYGTSALISLSS
ncbi:EpsG family protein [Brenneria populi subsp. brevivirga]|uniref:EpsG family protein n=1 Tax=Brenneria populi TaxID=1505588 RepID=UPI002E199CB4|nr:EpsG family protein [Brenneria populi subsp. brevivirga]